MNKTLQMRRAVYGFILFAGVMVWVPRVSNSWVNWREAKRLQNNVAVFYTTDTRGFLESCG